MLVLDVAYKKDIDDSPPCDGVVPDELLDRFFVVDMARDISVWLAAMYSCESSLCNPLIYLPTYFAI